MKTRIILATLIILMCLWVSPVSAQEAGVNAHDLADSDGQFIEINGVEIYYVERGPTDGPVVMLLHGFGGSTFTWRDTMDPLAEAGYHVIAFDRPPFGLSDKSIDLDYSVNGSVNITTGFMDALGIETATLVGHSAGGGVSAHFAAAYPERLDGLVLVAAAIPGGTMEDVTPDAAQDEGTGSPELDSLFSLAANLDPASPTAQAAMRSYVTPERFTEILSTAYFDDSIVTPDVAAGYQRPLLITGWEVGFLAYFTTQQATEPFDYEDLSSAIANAPILIIWGEEDRWVPLETGLALQEALPDSQMIVYSDVGHMAMEENIGQFNADVLDFLTTEVYGIDNE